MAFPLKGGKDQHLTDARANFIRVGIETVYRRVAYNRITGGTTLSTSFKPIGEGKWDNQNEL